MKILLDTHAFLWLMKNDLRLSPVAKTTFLDPKNEMYLSLASVWEIAIKSSLNKLKLPLPVNDYIDSRTHRYGIYLQEITMDYIALVEKLPFHHRDPFDRLIIAQGIFEKIPILTNDSKFTLYSIQTIW